VIKIRKIKLMNNSDNSNIDSFIWSTTYERYERNIKKDREDKRLGQWNLHEDKIKNLKYSYVYLKDSGNLIVKKYKIEKFEKSGFDKDFNDPKKWCFIFRESEDFFVDHPTVVQGRQYCNSLDMDNLKKPSLSERVARLNQSKNINSSEGKKKPKKSGINDPVLNQLAKLYKEKFPEKKLPSVTIVNEMVKRHKEGENLEDIVKNFIIK